MSSRTQTPMRLACIFLGCLAIFAIIGDGCGKRYSTATTKTTDTRSAQLPDDKAKIGFLTKYLKMNSPIDATEFHIVYRDNSAGVPGPSDWDMQIVMKMPADKVPLWTAGLAQTKQPIDLAWGYALLPKENRWAIKSNPIVYTRGSTVVAVFDCEGIVFKRTTSE